MICVTANSALTFLLCTASITRKTIFFYSCTHENIEELFLRTTNKNGNFSRSSVRLSQFVGCVSWLHNNVFHHHFIFRPNFRNEIVKRNSILDEHMHAIHTYTKRFFFFSLHINVDSFWIRLSILNRSTAEKKGQMHSFITIKQISLTTKRANKTNRENEKFSEWQHTTHFGHFS